MQLRKRQIAFKDACLGALAERGNTLGVAPTGAGKTVMLSAITGEYVNQGGSALIVQHRDELVEQNHATFRAVNPRATTGVWTADRKEWGYSAIFGMIQTLANDKGMDNRAPVDILAIDEGHHAAAHSYRQVIDRVMKRNPACKLLLVTATPNRGDKKTLRGIVDNVADQITLRELIEARLLVRPRTMVIDLGVGEQLAEVKRNIGDFDMSAVEAIMDKTVLNDTVVEQWAGVAANRQTVVFCSTVEHSKHVAETFRSAGYSAATVEGAMPERERRETIAAYDRGEIQVIVNVAVLTEGWDHQPTSCVILLRPSSYQSTMMQMIGRGLRVVDPERYPGVVKDDCIILDFGTSVLMHGSIEQQTDLDQKGVKDCPECQSTVPAQNHDCPICGYVWPKIVTGEDPEGQPLPGEPGPINHGREALSGFLMTEIDLLADTPFRYESLFGGLVMVASAIDAWVAVVSYFNRWHAVGGGKACGLHHLANADDRFIALSQADDFLRIHGDADASNKSKRWLSQPASSRQLELLQIDQMAGFGMTKYAASCHLEWKFNERHIRKMLEGAGQRMAA